VNQSVGNCLSISVDRNCRACVRKRCQRPENVHLQTPYPSHGIIYEGTLPRPNQSAPECLLCRRAGSENASATTSSICTFSTSNCSTSTRSTGTISTSICSTGTFSTGTFPIGNHTGCSTSTAGGTTFCAVSAAVNHRNESRSYKSYDADIELSLLDEAWHS
jgi:hypothetical protein